MTLLEIKDPVATATVRWLTAADGGRFSGPPTAPVYAATAVFCLGGEAETIPGWPASADQLSILVQQPGSREDGDAVSLIGFLSPDLARPYLCPGVALLVLEGPRKVAETFIREVIEGCLA